MGRSDEGAYELPPESRPGVLHRGVIGGGTISSPGLDPTGLDPTGLEQDGLDPAGLASPAGAGTRPILALLAVFAVVVVALATWGRDTRSAVATPADAAKATGSIGR